MAKFWESKEFKALNDAWNKKLEESGFKDDERDGRTQRFPKGSALSEHLKTPAVCQESKARYFELIAEFIHGEASFADDFDRIIMERTSEGRSIKEISAELRQKVQPGRQRGKFNRDTIRYVRRRYEHKWGIISWKAEDMQSRRKKLPSR